MSKLNCPPPIEILLIPGADNGFTITEKLCVELKLGVPLSATFNEKLLVESACVTSGRNENAPLLVSNVAFVAPASTAKVSVCGGWSVSVALAVNETIWPTFTVRFVIAVNPGGVLVGPVSVRAI